MTSFEPIKLAFNVYEPKEKRSSPDILMIHGITSCKEDWNKIAKKIADQTHRRVYALDMRNHGDSEWSDKFDYDIMTKDIMCFMDEHKIKKVAIIGHSMGGKVGITLSLVSPDKVEKLVVEDSTPKPISDELRQIPIGVTDLLMHTIQAIPEGADDETAKTIVSNAFSNFMPKEQLEKMEFSSFFVKKNNRHVWKGNLPILRKFLADGGGFVKTSPDASSQKLALFIYGTASPYNIIEGKDYILKLLPKATFQAIDGATHLVHVEYPEEFSNYAIEFINATN